MDAYQDITIPFQMSSTEFFTLVKDHLYEDGVLVVNLNMRGGENAMNTHIADTIGACFSQVFTADVDWTTNRELYASNGSIDILSVFREERAALSASSKAGTDRLSSFMKGLDGKIVSYRPGDQIMTDDKAPVELLSMKAIDGIIFDEVAYFKEIYKEKGIKGVIDALK